jgi:hypothetical protein
LCHPLLFTHARLFFPEHLLGRGMTFGNFLTIGGAGLVHYASGGYVERLYAAGGSHATVYASLHFAFASTMLLALAVYQLSPTTPARPK